MIKKVTCEKCGSLLEYDDRSAWEGNRDFEDIICPVCGKIVDKVFTDLIPRARLIKKGDKDRSKEK